MTATQEESQAERTAQGVDAAVAFVRTGIGNVYVAAFKIHGAAR